MGVHIEPITDTLVESVGCEAGEAELISIAALAEPFPNPLLETDLHQTVTPESSTTPSRPL